jgi:hypothetical protein
LVIVPSKILSPICGITMSTAMSISSGNQLHPGRAIVRPSILFSTSFFSRR